MTTFRAFVRNHWVGALFLLAALVVTVQRLYVGEYRVYRLYCAAFFDLLSGANLYADRSAAGLDYFRYSPTFALAFAPLAVLPEWLGLLLWNVVSALALYRALALLLPGNQARLAQLVVLGDMVRTMQNTQSNVLIAALMVMAFVSYEADRPWRGAAFVWAGAHAKLFPAASGIFALLRPKRVRAFVALAVTGIVFLALPALVTGPAGLIRQYRWWMAIGPGADKPWFSLMGLLDAWTGRHWPGLPLELLGLFLLLLPVAVRRDAWNEAGFRLLLLCSLLVFSVLFNHRAESPSYVIAVTGIAIWYSAGRRTRLDLAVLVFTLLFVTVAMSSLVPSAVRRDFLVPIRAMVLPLIAAWSLMQVQLWRWPRPSP